MNRSRTPQHRSGQTAPDAASSAPPFRARAVPAVASALATTLAASLLAAACATAGAPDPAPPLRAMVYNIHAGTDAAGEPNLDGVAALVLETGADVVLLQEVDRGTRRSGGVDQLAELQRRTGFHGAFGRTLDYQGGQYGIAVLSRWPILSETLVPLPVTPSQERAGGSYEPRGALRVTVDAPGGVVVVLNTHLDASRDDAYRRQEVETVLRLATAAAGDHGRAIVGGDFNAEPGSAVIRRMTDAGWTDAGGACGAGPGFTFPSSEPVKRIDYLFLAPGLACSDAAVLETTTSDHRPLLVTVREAR